MYKLCVAGLGVLDVPSRHMNEECARGGRLRRLWCHGSADTIRYWIEEIAFPPVKSVLVPHSTSGSFPELERLTTLIIH